MQTRSTKQKELINLSVLDLGKLERTKGKTQKLAMTDIVIRADVEGVLRVEDGQAYNEAGRDWMIMDSSYLRTPMRIKRASMRK